MSDEILTHDELRRFAHELYIDVSSRRDAAIHTYLDKDGVRENIGAFLTEVVKDAMLTLTEQVAASGDTTLRVSVALAQVAAEHSGRFPPKVRQAFTDNDMARIFEIVLDELGYSCTGGILEIFWRHLDQPLDMALAEERREREELVREGQLADEQPGDGPSKKDEEDEEDGDDDPEGSDDE